MSTRTAKEIERLLRDAADLRAEWIKQLIIVSDQRNTTFFDVGDVGYGKPRPEPEILLNARELAARAMDLDAPEAASLARTIITEFESANDRTDDHRLGPIRRAKDALARLTSAPR